MFQAESGLAEVGQGELRREAGLPRQLREYPVSRNGLHELAEEAEKQWTAGFNPRPVTRADFLGLYEAAY